MISIRINYQKKIALSFIISKHSASFLQRMAGFSSCTMQINGIFKEYFGQKIGSSQKNTQQKLLINSKLNAKKSLKYFMSIEIPKFYNLLERKSAGDNLRYLKMNL